MSEKKNFEKEEIKMKKINFAMDGGFSGNKMCLNGEFVQVPFSVVDITGKPQEQWGEAYLDDGYIRGTVDGKTYLVGQAAKVSLAYDGGGSEEGREMDAFSTMARYTMDIFKPALEIFIAYGLYWYCTMGGGKDKGYRLEELADYELVVGNALPHADVKKLAPVVRDYLIGKKKGKHSVLLKVGHEDAVNVEYTVSVALFNSQTSCCLVNEVFDEKGERIVGDSLYNHLPALVIDGGYKTMGKFYMRRDHSVTGGVSNIEYAMLNVNSLVAQKISEKSPGFKDYMVDERIENGAVVRYLEEGACKEIDVKQVKDEVMKDVVERYIAELLKSHDNLLDVEAILIAGGTGAAYYPYIKAYCEKERSFIHVVLAFQEEKTSVGGTYGNPVYAIAAGMYKCMIMQEKNRKE